MFKMNDVLAEANKQVAAFMAQGYMISFGNASFGYKFRVDLEHAEDAHYYGHVRVKVEEKYSIMSQSTITLSVIEIPKADGFESNDAAILFTKTWYVIKNLDTPCGDFGHDYLLTDSAEEAEEIADKRAARYEARRVTYYKKELTPSASLIRALKSRKGFSNATRTTVTVKRVAKGYEINLKARDGHVSRTENINFPKH